MSPRLEESVLRSAKRFSDGCPHMVRFAMQIDATNSILEISNSFGLSAKISVHGHGTVRPCTTTVLMEWTEPQWFFVEICNFCVARKSDWSRFSEVAEGTAVQPLKAWSSETTHPVIPGLAWLGASKWQM